MAYGVTANGFVAKTFDIIVAEKEAEAIVLFGADIDLTETSPLKMFIQVQALEEAKLWDMAESFYYTAFVDFATGASLDRVGALLGVSRNSAAKATGQVTFNGVNGTIIPIDTVVLTDTNIEFVTDVAGTIAGGTVTVSITAVLPGTDSNVAGATITLLKTPIVGVTSLSNANPTTGGTDLETDVSYRNRIKNYLLVQAKGTLESIRQAVLAVTGVTGCSATEDTDIHSANLMVAGVSKPDVNVDAAIEDTRPAGIYVTWDIPTTIDTYVDITVNVNSSAPGSASADIEAAIIAYVNGLGVGDDVIYTKVYDAVYDVEEAAVTPWIVDITVLKVDDVTPPVATVNLVIAVDEKALTDVAKVGVTLVVV